MKKYLDCETLKEMGVCSEDYSTHSFRQGGLTVLADGEVHPAFIKKSAQHKRWESSVTYINPSLRKALRANDLLSGNELSEGWGSQYLGNPRSFSLFLPRNSIKVTPSNAEVPHSRGSSVIMNTISHTVGSSNSEDTLSKKRSYVFDQVDSNVKKVRFDKNPAFLSETTVSSKPTF